MLKKTIPYIDLNGVERKEDFYFHLSKPEIVKMQTSVKGGYDVQLKSIGAPAYEVLFEELVTNDKAAADFVNAVMNIGNSATVPAIAANTQN